MAFTGPYPTKFSGHTTAMVISATTFSGGVTNAGTIGPGGVTITSSTFLTGGFLNTNLISGTANGISVLSDSTIHGAIVDSGTIRATKDGILVSGGVVSGGIQVASHGTISAGSSGIVVDEYDHVCRRHQQRREHFRQPRRHRPQHRCGLRRRQHQMPPKKVPTLVRSMPA